MDDWKKFNKTKLTDKKYLSLPNAGNITDADYTHVAGACKDSELKNLGELDDLFVLRKIVLLFDVFNNFQNVCLEIYGLDLFHVLSAPGLA